MKIVFKVDLNSDLGESFGNYVIGNDERVIDFITSVNVACGFHAGDPIVMEKTVRIALNKGVSIGAHPGYQDLAGFGRREMALNAKEVRTLIIYQLGALNGFVKAYGGKLQHIKPHGALYNTAAKDYNISRAIAEAVYDLDPEIIFLGLANSMMIKAAKDVGLKTANEVFADRAYNSDGTLVRRDIAGSIILDTNECISRVLGMVLEGKVKSIDGNDISIEANSICIHGDNIMALDFATALKNALLSAKVELKALSSVI